MSSNQLSKTDSEVSSQTQSSPARSPRQHAYYVQSPSRDSHDGEKTSNSFRSTPVISPMGSPPHSQSNSSVGLHSSRESSSTRLSGSLKPHRNKHHSQQRKSRKKDQFDAIEEEGLLDGDGYSHGITRRCYFLAFIVGFFVLFSMFSLILWGASRPQKPAITMKTILFDRFVIQAGGDSSGVATDMVSINCTVKLTFRNRGTFFGVHVSPTSLDLSYSQLTLATGTIDKFYQSRKSQRSIKVTVKGNYVPLYGGGAGLANVNGSPVNQVPMTLKFMLRSRGYVLGRLVKPKFYKKIECPVIMDPKKMNVAISLKNKCSYY